MANKKQRALELAKTEARISGIPKGGSALTGMSEAEKLAYGIIGTGTSARMIGSSTAGLAKLYKLYKAEKKAGKIDWKGTDTQLVAKKQAKKIIGRAKKKARKTYEKNKGVSVKRKGYANGGSVRAAKF